MFRVVTKEQAQEFDNRRLIEIILHLLDDILSSSPTNYYITGPYPNNGWTTKKGFLNGVERKKYKNICHLILSTSFYTLSFENWLLNDIKPKDKDHQCILFSINEKYCDSEKMELIYNRISAIFPADYAFIFQLPANFSPNTESKTKKGFFSSSTKSNQLDINWRKAADNVNEAILKDIYPINFINKEVFNADDFQKNIVAFQIGTLSRTENDLYKWVLINKEEIALAKQKLADTDLLLK